MFVSTEKENPDRLPEAEELRGIEEVTPGELSAAEETLESLMWTDTLGMYLKETGRFALLQPRQEEALARRAQQGDMAARQTMIEANLRLVVSIAKRYCNRGMPLVDLTRERIRQIEAKALRKLRHPTRAKLLAEYVR